MAWHLFGMLSTNFSAWSVGNSCHIFLIFCESYFRVNTRFPASFLFKTLQIFSIGFASGDCDGQSKVLMQFSVFQAVQRRLRCFGSLSSCKIQSAVSAPNIFVADLRRPRSYEREVTLTDQGLQKQRGSQTIILPSLKRGRCMWLVAGMRSDSTPNINMSFIANVFG